MKKIIKYHIFDSTNEFEQFQEEHEIDIIQIQPLVGNISLNIDEKGNVFNGMTNIKIFVTYTEKE